MATPAYALEAEPISPEEYVRQLEAIQAAATLRTEADLLAMRRALRRALGEVRAALAGWNALAAGGDRTGMMMSLHLGATERRMAAILADLERVVLDRMAAAWRVFWGLGVDSVVGPATSAGLLLTDLGVQWTQQHLMDQAVPQLIRSVTTATRRGIARELRRSMLLGERRGQVYGRMLRLLAGEPDRHDLGRFGGWEYQAERIHRTETHRLYHAGQDEAARRWRDAGARTVKVWRHSHARTVFSRPEHIAMDREVRALDARYSNGLRYPVDPDGSAEQTINCMCYQQILPVETARALGYRVPESMAGGLPLPADLPRQPGED